MLTIKDAVLQTLKDILNIQRGDLTAVLRFKNPLNDRGHFVRTNLRIDRSNRLFDVFRRDDAEIFDAFLNVVNVFLLIVLQLTFEDPNEFAVIVFVILMRTRRENRKENKQIGTSLPQRRVSPTRCVLRSAVPSRQRRSTRRFLAAFCPVNSSSTSR